ncbi:MAG: nicotinate phosphoribosyltransferase [Chloroflexi bacterium]|nr:nicotinate phosphoribosyltransferase [Chloroflexota bacterium]
MQTSVPLEEAALFTDLYELTMAASYLAEGMFEPATFSLFIRNYPEDRAYFVSAGLETVLDYLQNFHFSPVAVDYLRGTGLFKPDVLAYLSTLRFTGEVYAIPEGRLFFVDEPVLEVTAPVIEAQIIETYIVNAVHLETILATKASRCAYAARGRPVVDFSLRRTPGADAGMKLARACFITGFASTSNVLAGKRYGMPTSGTMAHSYVTSFPREIDAFRAFARAFPDRTTLLLDTYDTLAGARKAVLVAREMEQQGKRLAAVRLDSGDMITLAKQVRAILDEAGLHHVGIFASGGFDEYKIDEALEAGAPIDGFGVGTKVGTSADAPWMDMVYKMVHYGRRAVMKRSTGKATLADRKQVFRLRDSAGMFARDVIGLRDDDVPGAEKLLVRVMARGERVGPAPSLAQVREAFQRDFAALPEQYKGLVRLPRYPVEISPRLRALQEALDADLRQKEVG